MIVTGWRLRSPSLLTKFEFFRTPGVTGRESKNKMSALITNVEHALAIAAQDVVKTAKFVETSVLPVLKSAQANESTIESITSLVSPSAANIERAGFAVLGVVINALDAAGGSGWRQRLKRKPGRAARRGHQSHRRGCEGRGGCFGCPGNPGKVDGTEHQKETLRAMRREWSLDPHMP